ncbi:MAG TPA: hypothetical protein VMV10_12240 [Pirellulales bacterium]|nr:hypothetical protein [Pirellulales bacterium]
MNENPYKAPQSERDEKPRGFPRRLTVIEWIVIIGVVVVIGALFLPDVDDARQKALQRVGEKNGAQSGP